LLLLAEVEVETLGVVRDDPALPELFHLRTASSENQGDARWWRFTFSDCFACCRTCSRSSANARSSEFRSANSCRGGGGSFDDPSIGSHSSSIMDYGCGGGLRIRNKNKMRSR